MKAREIMKLGKVLMCSDNGKIQRPLIQESRKDKGVGRREISRQGRWRLKMMFIVLVEIE